MRRSIVSRALHPSAGHDCACHNRCGIHWRIEQTKLIALQTKQLPRFAAVLYVMHEQAGETIPGSEFRCCGYAWLNGLLILNRVGCVADLQLCLISHDHGKRLTGDRKRPKALVRSLQSKCHRK